PEPHWAIPQGQSAHDTFWDYVSLQPETLHNVMWAMSDRGIPRIPCQQDRLQMFIGFQQVIARVTALTQGAEVAAGHHHRIHR
ncbi:catalase, partial [Klebsiella pneumoniae]|uniref:catalase n=1 Tax=Klebsiella pneumoniae TaxID=573 RepID=UPI00214C7FE6